MTVPTERTHWIFDYVTAKIKELDALMVGKTETITAMQANEHERPDNIEAHEKALIQLQAQRTAYYDVMSRLAWP